MFKKMTKGQAVMLAVIGIIVGTVFVFLRHYWQSPILKEDAISVQCVFDRYEINYGRRHQVQDIRLYFSDRDSYYIDGMCVNDKLTSDLDGLKSGETVYLMVHPNSDTVLEMSAKDYIILDFDEVQQKLQNENKVFAVLGVIMYTLAFCGIAKLSIIFIKIKNLNKVLT